MRRVLFVDDEPSVLHGLARLLRPMRDSWNMTFSESGREALELMQAESFDVVVADVLMPEMNGIELFAQVSELFPATVRILLSGRSDRDALLESVEHAHQSLSKPCDPQTLKSTVDRACFLRGLLTSERLLRLASQIRSLPSLPALYVQIQEELAKPESSMEAVGRIIARDVAMSAKVLQLVNSAFFGLRRSVSDPVEAAVFLGLDTIKALVLSAQVFSQFDPDAVPGFSIDELWEHSLRTGNWARVVALAEGCDKSTAEQCFTAGMLHEIGRLVIATNLPEKYLRARALAHKIEQMAVAEAERRVLGASHDVVGGYLLGIWGLPHPIVEAIACLHRPDSCPHEGFSVLTALHAANAIDVEMYGEVGQEGETRLCTAYLERLDLLGRLEVWREACRAAADRGQEDVAA